MKLEQLLINNGFTNIRSGSEIDDEELWEEGNMAEFHVIDFTKGFSNSYDVEINLECTLQEVDDFIYLDIVGGKVEDYVLVFSDYCGATVAFTRDQIING